MNKPDIKTAIPKRRYQLGEYVTVVLGDVDSSDTTRYAYVMAVLREDQEEPGLYLTAESAQQEQPGDGAYAMRLIMPDGETVIGKSDAWGDEETFTNDGLKMVSQILNLTDEEPYRLV